MQITVKLFAILRDRAGVSELSINLPAQASVSWAAEQLQNQLPSIGDFLGRIAYAVNREYVARDTILHDGDELALIPPVSGG